MKISTKKTKFNDGLEKKRKKISIKNTNVMLTSVVAFLDHDIIGALHPIRCHFHPLLSKLFVDLKHGENASGPPLEVLWVTISNYSAATWWSSNLPQGLTAIRLPARSWADGRYHSFLLGEDASIDTIKLAVIGSFDPDRHRNDIHRPTFYFEIFLIICFMSA